MRSGLLALSVLSSGISLCSDNRNLSQPSSKPFFISAINECVLKDPAKKLQAGKNTCCTYFSAEIFNDKYKFVLLFDENDLPFFLWGQQLMYLVTNDFGSKLKPDDFDFGFVVDKQRMQGMKARFTNQDFMQAINKSASLLQSPQINNFINDVCHNKNQQLTYFIRQQPTTKKQRFFSMLRMQIIYLHHYHKIPPNEILQHLVHPIGEAQFSFGLENMTQILITNPDLTPEDKQRLTDFIEKLQVEKKYLLSDEQELTKYCQHRLQKLLKYKRDLSDFLNDVAENPSKYPNFSSKIPKNCSDDLPIKINQEILQLKQDIELLTKYYKNPQNVAKDLTKQVAIFYWPNQDEPMQKIALETFQAKPSPNPVVSSVAVDTYCRSLFAPSKKSIFITR